MDKEDKNINFKDPKTEDVHGVFIQAAITNTKKQKSPEQHKNLAFLENRIPAEPGGYYIENFLEDWWDDYERLEEDHGYIQWIFPLREKGANPLADPLTEEEIRLIKLSETAMWSIKTSYQLMLGFYGIKLNENGN